MKKNFKEIIKQFDPKNVADLLIGYDEYGTLHSHNFRRNNSLLIVGQTGVGKSVTIKQMVLSGIYKQSPKDIQFALFDPSRTDYLDFENSPYLLEKNIMTDVDILENYLMNLNVKLDDRVQQMREIDVSDIDSYNIYALDNGLETMPCIITVIDEISYIEGRKPEIYDNLITMIKKAQNMGIYFIIGTQDVRTNVVKGKLKLNISSRIALKVPLVTQSRVAIDVEGAEKLNTYGEMIYMNEADKTILQNTCLSEEEVKNNVG